MKNLLLILLGLPATALAQAPAPAAILNPASNILAGLPNSGIAQGSIFVVYGKGMGPAGLTQATSLPLPTTAGLAGTLVQVTVGGVTATAPMLYTLATQLAGILPSNIPIGTGTLTVTYNGQSGSTPVQVVQSNFGVSTVNQTGAGPAVVTFPDYSLVTAAKSASPGDTLVLWGTGLGPITTGDSTLPPQTDLGTPITVYVGGVAANVTYRGRSAGVGLDQINFVVPSGLSGCNVSLFVQTQSQTRQTVSNSPTLPIAPHGGQCSDPTGVPPSVTSGLSGKTTLNGAGIILGQGTSFTGVPNAPTGTSTFNRVPAASLSGLSLNSIYNLPTSVGSCALTGLGSLPPASAAPVGLDAGTAISVASAAGSGTLAPDPSNKGSYTGSLSSFGSGSYVISNGKGGADIGPFSVTLNVPAPLVWTNRSVFSAPIDRTRPLSFTWTGGDANSFVQINAASYTTSASGLPTAAQSFTCVASALAGQITVPAALLLALPPTSTSSSGIPVGAVILSMFGQTGTFTSPGIDYGFLFWGTEVGAYATFR